MITEALRMRLLPAVKVVATGRIIVGKRSDVHVSLVPDGGWPVGPPDKRFKTWRGYYDPLYKHWYGVNEVPDGIDDPRESETERICRELTSEQQL
jgi:hypothetical protein